MTTPTVASSSNPTRSCIAATRSSGPSSLSGGPSTSWPSNSAPPTTRSAPWCGTSAPRAGRDSFPPFHHTVLWATAKRLDHLDAGGSGGARRRRRASVGPHPGTILADPSRRHLPLPAVAGPVTLRPVGAAGGLPRLAHGPRRRCPLEPAGLEAPGQRAAVPHQRLQLRRGPRPLRRAEHPSQGDLRHRLLRLCCKTPFERASVLQASETGSRWRGSQVT